MQVLMLVQQAGNGFNRDIPLSDAGSPVVKMKSAPSSLCWISNLFKASASSGLKRPGAVNVPPRVPEPHSVVEIERGFAYDGSVFHRILSTPSFIRS